MRLCINVIKDGEPRLIEEDIEIALGKLPWTQDHQLTAADWQIDEQATGCFTADTEYSGFGDITGIENALKRRIEEETGGEVKVEMFKDFPPPGWSP